MTLQEIFTDKPELLNEPDVKRLIDYVQAQNQRHYKIYTKYQTAYLDVIDHCMNSEVVVINGNASREVITNILAQYGDNDL